MDPRTLAELPTAHAVALRLREAGAGEATIGVALGIPMEGVRALLEVADAKLASIRTERPHGEVS